MVNSKYWVLVAFKDQKGAVKSNAKYFRWKLLTNKLKCFDM